MKVEDLISKNQCCGCKLCQECCPTKAIKMVEGEVGTLYPNIDESKCIDCNLCKKNCPAHKELNISTQKAVYAAINKKENYLMTSASGGVFSALAENVIKKSGVVYGAAMLKDDQEILAVKHVRVTSLEDLYLLQGSKYLQSNMEGIYAQIKSDIKANVFVLFCGTPCQVAAVKSLCGTPENLLLVELICHGVPSQRFFTDYLKTLQKNNSSDIESFNFRAKESGWGLCAILKTKNRRGKIKVKRIPCNISSYYKMFLRCETYRDSCYQCKYAVQDRVGDLTIGDYWGVEKDSQVYNEILSYGYDVTKGVSCVIVSSEKGLNYLKESNLQLFDSTFESISRENGQLIHPSRCPDSRNEVICEYKNNGYPALEKDFNKKLGVKKYMIILKNKIPPKLRMSIKMLLKR